MPLWPGDLWEGETMNNKYITFAREALINYGSSDSIDLQHILAVLIGPKATPEICGKLASYGVRQLSEMVPNEMQNEGLTEIEAQRIFASFVIARKWGKTTKEKNTVIRSPEDVSNHLRLKISFEKQEHFYVLYLNTKNEIIHEEDVFKGSLNSAIVHPREIFRIAIKHAAAAIICAHNHPSGDPTPSREDLDVTRRLVEVGKITGIQLLDHLIIGDSRCVSLKEKGYIN